MAYSIFMVFYNGLPIVNVFQTLITLKLLFVYFAVAYAIKYNKVELLSRFTRMLTGILLFSVIFVISDYVIPNVLFKLAIDRGITPGSFFSSRVLYSGFILLYSILLLSFKFNTEQRKYFIYKPNVYWGLLILSFVLIVLTFSRKEILLLLLVYTITFLYRNKGRARLFASVAIILLSPIILFFLWRVFGESVTENFNEGYVRYKIFIYALEIFEYYFPFGSGPGTYGTVMSKLYSEVYIAFQVPNSIIGYGNKIEGPIFDLFFVSLCAEYGLGVILVFYFIFQPFFSQKNYAVDNVIHIGLMRFNLFLMLVGIGFMVPIMGNVVGLLLFFLLGIITSRSFQVPVSLYFPVK